MKIYKFLLIGCFSFLVSISFSATKTWTGSVNSNFNNGGNWSPAGAPGVGDVALFDGTSAVNCDINVNVSIQGVSITVAYLGTISQLAGNTIVIGSGGFSQAGGLFVGGNSAITINSTGLFALSGGTFTNTSGNFTISGTRNPSQTLFTHSGGTFNHNNGTFIINPNQNSGANAIYTIDILPATTFYNVIVNGTAGWGTSTIATGAGDVVIASNDLTHTDGIISGTFEVKNNLIVNTTADAGLGTITFSGTGAQTYAVTGTPRTCKIAVDKLSGAVTPAGGTTNFYMQGFTQTLGDFTAPTGTMNVGGTLSATQTIYSHVAGTFSHNNGTVVLNPNQSSGANAIYTIDILPTTTFYNVIVNGTTSWGTSTIATGAGDVVIASNDLTHTDGIIAGTFEVKNNLIINATSDGGLGTITFSGTGAQTYTVAGGAPRTCKIAVNKSSGAVTPAGGTTDFYMQGFTQTLGDFTAPTGTMNVGGTLSATQTIYSHVAGTFTHNNGTVALNPNQSSGANAIYTIDILPTTTFYNVIVNGTTSWGTSTIATGAGDVVIASNDLTHTDGIIAGTFEVKNNLIINATSDGGLGTITFSGTGAQTYTVAGGAPRTCKIAVNKSSGAVTPAGGTTDFYMQGFTQTLGDFTAPTGTMNVGGTLSATQTIYSHVAGTFTHNNGTVVLNPNQSSGANAVYTIDVLPATLFYDFIINGTTSWGTSTIATAAGDLVQADNDFTHTDGIISGQFALRNNLFINATSDGGLGTITFNGAGAQTYTVAGGAPRTCRIAVNKAAGAVTPAGGTTDFYMQGFTQTLGDFTAPTGTMNVGGTLSATQTIYSHVAGTFTHNNGTVVLNPNQSSGANAVYTIDVLPATLFYDFIINGTTSWGTSTIATAAGDLVQADNDFTHTDGIISGQFALRNNLFINATSDGGLGTITFNGTGAQTYTVAGGAPRTCKIAVNKTAGGVTPAGGTTDFYMQGFTQTLGDFTAPTGTMNVGGTLSATQTIYSHVSGTFTHNNGTVVLNPNQSSGANAVYTIDVLPATLFYDFIINGTTSWGTSTITTAAGDLVQADNDFTHTDGIISGQFGLRNNLFINATSDGGLGTITFNGTGAQTYTVAAGAPRTCKIAVNKTAGGVTPAGGTTDFYMQGFTQTLGDFTAPTGDMNVGGPLSATQTIYNHVAGTYTHNNGTVVFNPTQNSGANAVYTVNIINSTSFYNVIVNGISSWGTSTLTTAAGDTIDVENDLVYTDGIATATLEVAGNVTVESGHDGGNGLLIFKNGNAQNFDLTGATANFNGDIKLKKTANNISLLSDLQMDGANQDLFFVKGDMVIPSLNMVIIGDNVTATGGSDSSFVDGRMRKIGNEAFTFPIGKNDTAYAPIAITAPTNVAHHFTAEYFQTDPNPSYDVTSKVASLDHLSRCEYWILDRTNGASNVFVSLSWNDRSCGVTTLADLRVARWDGTQWQNHGNGLTTGTTASGTVRSSAAVTSFSPFTLSSTTVNNPLPIELLTFNAIPNGKKVDLKWSTASEKNNDYFTVEKSTDAQVFEFVAEIDGAGNSTDVIDYTTSDNQPYSGVSYYRLKQTDFNGEYSYSSIVAVNFSENESGVFVYPNPADLQNGFNIEFSSICESCTLIVMDATGRKVYESKVQSKKILIDQIIAPGLYFIQYTNGLGVNQNQKIILK